jgi:SAM-dependent methyltransferase
MTVLNVGGRTIKGQHDPRSWFENDMQTNYTVLDIQADPSVDVVNPPGEEFPFDDGAFDVTITTSTFEHDPMFWLTIREMIRVTRLGGMILTTSPAAGHYHPYPGDNWRFMQDSGAALAFWCGKKFHGRAVPLALNATWQGKGGSFVENVMIFQRVARPATSFTLLQLGLDPRGNIPHRYASARTSMPDGNGQNPRLSQKGRKPG